MAGRRKGWERRVESGKFWFGRTRTGTVVVGYIQDGDAETIFPDLDSEHVVTPNNIDDFREWLADKNRGERGATESEKEEDQ